ncbi:hypothetical protein [Novipirellula rosea]|uniref:PilZ domain-containing protein n=1 Tax=Novipirellula rosea TaxID=1031540 RepID=A0ABP8MMT4_9BACT
MFSFLRRKEECRAEAALRRILDRTTPNVTFDVEDNRCHNRYHRTLPVLVTPCRGNSLLVDQSVVGLTRDISDNGMSVLLSQALDSFSVAVSIWLASRQSIDPHPVTLLGLAAHSIEIGGGYWHTGIHLTDRLEDHALSAQLLPLVEKLLPSEALVELAKV